MTSPLSSTMSSPLISCISIMICDDFLRDEKSLKLALWGTFNRITTPAVPCVHRKLCLFLTFTGGHGDREIRVSIEKASTGQEISHVQRPFPFQNPLAIVDVSVTFPKVSFDEFGKHWVVVKNEGRILVQRPFFVIKGQPEDTPRESESTGG